MDEEITFFATIHHLDIEKVFEFCRKNIFLIFLLQHTFLINQEKVVELWRKTDLFCGIYLGAGASGAEVIDIMSGSLIGIMPKVMFLEEVS